MKVVINRCYGGFSLSKAAVLWLAKKKFAPAMTEKKNGEDMLKKYGPERPKSGDTDYWDRRTAQNWAEGDADNLMSYSWHPDSDDTPRHHPLLVECAEKLGRKAGGSCARLEVVEIPDDVDYEIGEYDGMEHIAERHRTWA